MAAEVQSIVVRDPDTGLVETHVIVAVNDLAQASRAILSTFESIVARERDNPAFSGRIVFTVRGPDPETPSPAALAAVQSQLDAQLTPPGIQTAAGRPFDVSIEYKRVAFLKLRSKPGVVRCDLIFESVGRFHEVYVHGRGSHGPAVRRGMRKQ
jgi:hypothetical protein